MNSFGEYCPICDKNGDEVFVVVSKGFRNGDIVICSNGHELKCTESDSQYIDVELTEI